VLNRRRDAAFCAEFPALKATRLATRRSAASEKPGKEKGLGQHLRLALFIMEDSAKRAGPFFLPAGPVTACLAPTDLQTVSATEC
jgi:hypothetical protein